MRLRVGERHLSSIIGKSEGESVSLAPHTVRPSESVTFHSVTAGVPHSFAAGTSGGVWCWGRGSNGELGRGVARDSSVEPRRLPGLSAIKVIVAGRSHTCALGDDYSVWCWDAKDNGQLGLADARSSLSPRRVEITVQFESISASPNGVCGLDHGGEAYCWGEHTYLGDLVGRARIPAKVRCR